MTTGTPYRVLVVDDELPWAQLVAEWLGQAGHQVEITTSAEAGLARLRDEAFDVALGSTAWASSATCLPKAGPRSSS
jgi:CheY-like chemotaxis protein